jgi:hypothetical protein
MGAFRETDRNHITVRHPRRLTGSIYLDTALKTAFPESPRRDYGIGYSNKRETIYWLEMHPASRRMLMRFYANMIGLKIGCKHMPRISILSPVNLSGSHPVRFPCNLGARSGKNWHRGVCFLREDHFPFKPDAAKNRRNMAKISSKIFLNVSPSCTVKDILRQLFGISGSFIKPIQIEFLKFSPRQGEN